MTAIADRPWGGVVVRDPATLIRGRRAYRSGSLTPDLSNALYETLAELVRRGQRGGVVRPDLVADDLPRVIAMLHTVLFTMDSGSDGWRRYVALMLDAIAVDKRRSLPAATALRFVPSSSGWPM
jgi:hypothetical protein